MITSLKETAGIKMVIDIRNISIVFIAFSSKNLIFIKLLFWESKFKKKYG